MAKPPFPWIGSKEKIAPYILQLFPPKLTQYVEPFGGSGAVLLALPPDPNRLDIYNDLDAELVNLFSCIKECSNVLLRELRFLPIHGRKLFEYYRDFVAHKEVYFQNVQAEIECLGDRSCFTEEQAGELLPIFQERLALYDVKRAAAYYLAIRGSFSGTINSFGVKGLDVERFLKLFPPVSARLKDVPLENKNALQLIRERDKKGSLIVDRTNALRRAKGVAALRVNDKLMQAAQVRADEMAASGIYSHTRPDGRKSNTVTDSKYTGENLHNISELYLNQQQKTLSEAVVNLWSNSKAHADNMTSSRYGEIGVGLARGVNQNGLDCWYCVQVFLLDGCEVTWVDTPAMK